MFLEQMLFLSYAAFILVVGVVGGFARRAGMSFVLGSEAVLLADVLAVALVALVLVLSVRDGHRRDGSVMWGDVAASGLTAAALVAAGLVSLAAFFCL